MLRGLVGSRAYEAVVREILEAYLPHHRALEMARRTFSPVTRDLAEMAVGEIRVFEGTNATYLNQRMKRARNILESPSATWRTRTLPDMNMEVERLPNGAKALRNLTHSPIVAELTAMAPGDVIISKAIANTRTSMGSHVRPLCRRHLGEPRADWRLKTVGGKVQVTRLR